MYKWCHESRRKYTFVKLKATKISKRCVLFWSRGPGGYRKNDRKRAVVWPWLMLELSTVLALTQLGIWQSDWRRAGIRSTNLHIVVEFVVSRGRRDPPTNVMITKFIALYLPVFCLVRQPLPIIRTPNIEIFWNALHRLNTPLGNMLSTSSKMAYRAPWASFQVNELARSYYKNWLPPLQSGRIPQALMRNEELLFWETGCSHQHTCIRETRVAAKSGTGTSTTGAYIYQYHVYIDCIYICKTQSGSRLVLRSWRV